MAFALPKVCQSLQETVRSFKVTNEELAARAASSGQDVAACDAACKVSPGMGWVVPGASQQLHFGSLLGLWLASLAAGTSQAGDPAAACLQDVLGTDGAWRSSILPAAWQMTLVSTGKPGVGGESSRAGTSPSPRAVR